MSSSMDLRNSFRNEIKKNARFGNFHKKMQFVILSRMLQSKHVT